MLIVFPDALPGLRALTRFDLRAVDEPSGLFALQSTEEEIRLFLLDAGRLPEYRPALPDQPLDGQGSRLFVVITPGERGARPSVNLLAPIVIDEEQGLGRQTIAADRDISDVQVPLGA